MDRAGNKSSVYIAMTDEPMALGQHDVREAKVAMLQQPPIAPLTLCE